MKKSLKIIALTVSGLFLGILILFAVSEIYIGILTHNADDSALFDVAYVEVDGVQVAYRELVSEGDETLFIIHGFLGSSYEYINLFSERDVTSFNTRVIALDIPGFGLSDKPLDYVYTNDNHAATLLAAMTQLESGSFSLMGHSLGGEIVQRIAQKTEAVDRLILVNPVPPDMTAEPTQIPTLFYTVFFKNYWLQRLGINTATVEPLNQDVFQPFMIQNHRIPSAVLQQFSLDVDLTSLTDLDVDFDRPILIMYGALDRWTPPALLKTYQTLYPEAEGHIIAGVGHLPYLENPDFTRALIENFLNN